MGLIDMELHKAKRAAAERAVSYVKDGMTVGLGTGSTAKYVIEFLGKMVADGLKILGVPTSISTTKLADELSIPLLYDFEKIDLTIDGADEVDPNGNLIKGGGGAMTREKIVAAASSKRIMIVDETKLVQKLGAFPLPVEVLPFGWRFSAKRLAELGCQVNIRMSGGGDVFLTDNHNYILDCRFEKIVEPDALSREINSIPGVLENGLFVKRVQLVVVGDEKGGVREIVFE